MVGCGEIGHVRTGQGKHRNFTSRNMFIMVANGGHEGHESKGSHLDKLKSVKSVTSDVYKNISLRTTGIYVHIGLNGLNGCSD